MITLFDSNGNIISRNDDYYGTDSLVSMQLGTGTYYVAVTSTGNTNFNPAIPNTGFGGTTQGSYQLRMTFTPATTNGIKDTTGTLLDGDADGSPGGNYNFWFNVASAGQTIFVDKVTGVDLAPTGANGAGSITAPYKTIAFALAHTAPGSVVRIEGNFGPTNNPATSIANWQSYNIGFDSLGNPLSDGSTFQIPAGVTVMVDAGAIIKLHGANIDVGSVTPGTAAGGALQLLGTPTNSVYLTSYYNSAFGTDPGTAKGPLKPGDWGGIVFHSDADDESQGIFLDYVNHAFISFGGGQVNVNSVLAVYDPIHLISSRPTITFNTITNSADAAVSADPNSFQESEFQSEVPGSAFQADYSRVGPQIRGNTLGVNSTTLTVPSAGGSAVIEGETFVVNGVTFKFTKTGTAGTQVINITNSMTAVQVAAAIQASLVANPIAGVLSTTSGSSVLLFGLNTFSQSASHGIVAVNSIQQNSINGLFVRIRTDLSTGSVLDPLTVSARFSTTDMIYVVEENLEIQGQPGGFDYVSSLTGQVTDPSDPNAVLTARPNARLSIDPGVVIKLGGARIETEIGSQLIAEGTASNPIVFTSVFDDRYGAAGSFDTTNDGSTTTATAGNWGGLFFGPLSTGSVDHALITFGGGTTTVEGGFGTFDAVEIHQAKVRIADSVLENNAAGGDSTDRAGRSSATSAVIFVRGAQPVIVNNTIQNNDLAGANANTAAISINVNSLNSQLVTDWGDSIGAINLQVVSLTNDGPLVRGNKLDNNPINGMLVRGGIITTDVVFDDTDIVQVVEDLITTSNQFSLTGTVRLQSSSTESLVVKLLGATAGFTASGEPLDITDRYGGAVQIIGTPNHPVVMTSLYDTTAGAGFTPSGQPQNDTANRKGATTPAPTPGDWVGVTLDTYSNDTNIDVVNEAEQGFVSGADTNSTPSTAQYLGILAKDSLSGDDNARLGFTIHGSISQTFQSPGRGDVDVYSFQGTAGTPVWIDMNQTASALDAVVELVDANGAVLARSDNAIAEQANPSLLVGIAKPFQTGLPGSVGSFSAPHFFSTNPLDPAMRVELPGTTGTINTYYIRVRASNKSANMADTGAGLTKGEYQLQIRLQEEYQYPGNVVRNADIRYAVNGVQVVGKPEHSPLEGTTSQTIVSNPSLTAAPGGGTAVISGETFTLNSSTIINAVAVGTTFTLTKDTSQTQTGFIQITDTMSSADVAAAIAAAVGTTVTGVTATATGSTVTFAGATNLTQSTTHSLIEAEPNGTFDTAQNLGNLLDSSNSSISVAGQLSSPLQVDWFKFNLNYDLVQAIANSSDGLKTFAAMFAIDYADGLTRPDTTMSIFDQAGNLILIGRGSDVVDAQPTPGQGSDTANASHGQFGTLDPTIGSVQLPAGGPDPQGATSGLRTYYVAVSSSYNLPTVLDATFKMTATNPLVRLQPVDSMASIINDTIGASNAQATATPPAQQAFPGSTPQQLNLSATPFSLGDVVMYVNDPEDLYTVNPFTGQPQTWITNPSNTVQPTPYGTPSGQSQNGLPHSSPGDFTNEYFDIAMRSDGRLFTFPQGLGTSDTAATNGTYRQLDTTDGAIATTDKNGLGDQSNPIVTQVLDPTTPITPIPLSYNFKSAGGTDAGVSYNGMTFGYDPNVLSDTSTFPSNENSAFGQFAVPGRALFAVGNRNPDPSIQWSQNLLFALDANTGAPLNTESAASNGKFQTFNPVPDNSPLVDGSGTSAIPQGQLTTGVSIISVPATSATDPTNDIQDGQQFRIGNNPVPLNADGTLKLDSSGNVAAVLPAGVTFEFDSGPILTFPNTATPAAGLHNNDSFKIGNTVFVFKNDGGTAFPNKTINFNTNDSAATLGAEITAAINGAGPAFVGVADFSVHRITINTTSGGSGTGAFNSTTAPTLINDGFTITGAQGTTGQTWYLQTGPGSSLSNGETFSITSGTGVTTTFEFRSSGAATGTNVKVTFTATDSSTTVAQEMVIAINSTVGLSGVASFTGGAIVINGGATANFSALTAPLPGGPPPVPSGFVQAISPAPIAIHFTASESAATLAAAIAAKINNPTNDPTKPATTPVPDGASSAYRVSATVSQGAVQGEQTDNLNSVFIKLTNVMGSDLNLNPTLTPNQLAPSFGIGTTTVYDPLTTDAPENNIFGLTDTDGQTVYGENLFGSNGFFFGQTGDITGIAFVPTPPTANGTARPDRLFAVSDTGALYEVTNFNFLPNANNNGATLTLLNVVSDLSGGIASKPNGLNGLVNFTGLTAGPPDVENGTYKYSLFATDEQGNLWSFDVPADPTTGLTTAAGGQLAHVFLNGATHVDTGLPELQGVTFSTLDYNLWHVTAVGASDPGHGSTPSFDFNSATTGPGASTSGGDSFYFGLENPTTALTPQPGSINYLPNASNPAASSNMALFNSYNLPGGAYGSLQAQPFSLQGYTAADEPTLYFNYSLDTQDANGGSMQDSFRVYGSSDGGVHWEELVTNNSTLSSPRTTNSELPSYISSSGGAYEGDASNQQVQEAFDPTGTPPVNVNTDPNTTAVGWRQARVDLGDFAGQSNVMLRFDFSTAGALGIGATLQSGVYLGAPAATPSLDGQSFSVNNSMTTSFNTDGSPVIQTLNYQFTFRSGLVLTVPAGGAQLINEGETFTVNGTTFTFTKTNATGAGLIHITNSMNADDVAKAIAAQLTQLPYQLQIPTGGGSTIQDAETFTANGITFQMQKSAPTPTPIVPGNVGITYNSTATAAQVTSLINTAIQNQSLSLTVPGGGGVLIQEGETFTVNGTTFTMTHFGAGTHPINFLTSDSNSQIAAKIVAAVASTVPGVQAVLNGTNVQFVGATSLTQSAGHVMTTGTMSVTAPTGTNVIDGETFTVNGKTYQLSKSSSAAPGNVEIDVFSGMSAAQVAQAIQTVVLANPPAGVTPVLDGVNVIFAGATSLSQSAAHGLTDHVVLSGVTPVVVAGTNITLTGVTSIAHSAGHSLQLLGAAPGVTPIVSGASVQLNGATSLSQSAVHALIKTGSALQAPPGATSQSADIPYNINMSAGDMSVLVAKAMDAKFTAVNGSAANQLPADNLDSPNIFTSSKIIYMASSSGTSQVPSGVLQLIGHSVVSAGPLDTSSTLTGDSFGNFYTPIVNGVWQGPTVGEKRGQDNAHEGVFIDDIQVGFAGRGEMVTGTYNPTADLIAQQANPTAPIPITGLTTFTPVPTNPDPTVAKHISVGVFQLDIRPATQYAATLNDGFPYIGLFQTYDITDRFTQAFTLTSIAAETIVDLSTFTLDTQHVTVTFQFVTNATEANTSSASGNIPVLIHTGDSDAAVALAIQTAINTVPVAKNFNVKAGVQPTSKRIDLFGDADEVIPGQLGLIVYGAGALGDTPIGGLTGSLGGVGDTVPTPAPQGYTIIQNNRISNSLKSGLSATPQVVTDANGNPIGVGVPGHTGAVSNLPTLNTSQLVPGISFFNNLIVNSGQTGILFSGSPTTDVTHAIPFGRIYNNTIVGAPIGINVVNNASPTLLNNIIAQFLPVSLLATAIGINVDSTSTTTVVGESVYENNATNLVGVAESNAINLSNDKNLSALFVNAAAGNFYLAEGSPAIDSSLNTLPDRPQMVAVDTPLGIPASAIQAPNFDLLGQLRVDDPNVSSPPGLGSNVFKDRGAIERADFAGPTASLINPQDNDAAGVDRNPSVNQVLIVGKQLTNFSIQLSDTGVGVDDSTVDIGKFSITRNGVPLVGGTDYSLSYDPTNNIAQLIPPQGVWADGTYVITLNNTNSTNPIKDLAGNGLAPNDATGVTQFVIQQTAVAAASWQNPVNKFDVNNDGFISGIDALLIIDSLITQGPRPLPGTPTVPPDFYYDVNGDGFLSPQDLLSITQYLNTFGVTPDGHVAGAAAATSQATMATPQVVTATPQVVTATPQVVATATPQVAATATPQVAVTASVMATPTTSPMAAAVSGSGAAVASSLAASGSPATTPVVTANAAVVGTVSVASTSTSSSGSATAAVASTLSSDDWNNSQDDLESILTDLTASSEDPRLTNSIAT